MYEDFYEESALTQKTKSSGTRYNICSTAAIISFAIAVYLAIKFVMTFDLKMEQLLINLIFTLLPIFAFVGIGIFLNFFRNRFYVDYDYTFVSGSIRFSKVIKNKKRKFIAIFDVKDIDAIGKFGSETFVKYLNMNDMKKYVLTSNRTPSEGLDFYYLVATVKGVRSLFVLECSRRLVSNILQRSRRAILEEGFK